MLINNNHGVFGLLHQNISEGHTHRAATNDEIIRLKLYYVLLTHLAS